MSNIKYCVITTITNNYEPPREPLEIDKNADYYLLTDSKTIKSKYWKPIYVKEIDIDTLTGIQKNFILKYQFYKYIPNLNKYSYLFFIDGSIQICKSFNSIINYLDNNKYDLSIGIHPIREYFKDEYNAWVSQRNLNSRYMNIFFNNIRDYDYENVCGLCETSIKIFKNNKNILNFIDDIHNFMTHTCDNKDANDQCYFTYILYKYINILRINYHSARLYRNSDYMKMFCHNSLDMLQPFELTMYNENDIKPFLGKLIKISNIL